MAGKLDLRKWRKGTILLIVAALGLIGAAPARAASACANAYVEATAATGAQVTEALACVINEQRAQSGLAVLKVNSRLARAARQHSADMVARSYFAHQSSGGNTMVARAKRAGYLRKARSFWVAENIAWGTGELSSPAAVVDSWLESPAHRANMLSTKARELGLGMASGSPSGGSDGAVFTLMLGKRN